jgi:hypothetical protein
MSIEDSIAYTVHGSLERVRAVTEDEAPPTTEPQGVRPLPRSTHVAWYVTGTRDASDGSGIPMCNALLYVWDNLDQHWIMLSPQRPVVEAGIIEQRHYGAPVAISLRDVRGAWSIKARFFRS